MLKGKAKRAHLGGTEHLPLITEEGAALLTDVVAHVLCGNPNQAGLVQLDSIERVVC